MSEEETKEPTLKLHDSELFYLMNLNKEIQGHEEALGILRPKREVFFGQVESRLDLPPGGLASYDLSPEGGLTKKPRTNPPYVASIAHKASKRNRSRK